MTKNKKIFNSEETKKIIFGNEEKLKALFDIIKNNCLQSSCDLAKKIDNFLGKDCQSHERFLIMSLCYNSLLELRHDFFNNAVENEKLTDDDIKILAYDRDEISETRSLISKIIIKTSASMAVQEFHRELKK